MTPAAPGVLRRRPNDVRAARYRKLRDPLGPFHEEAADAELRLCAERKLIAIRARKRR